MVLGNSCDIEDISELEAIQALGFVKMHDGGCRAEISDLLRCVGDDALAAALQRGWLAKYEPDVCITHEGEMYYDAHMRESDRPGDFEEESPDLHRVRDGLRFVDIKYTIYGVHVKDEKKVSK